MMQHASNHQRQPMDEDEDRRNRFRSSQGAELGSGQRATSQPPQSSDQGFLSSPAQQHRVPSSFTGGSWSLRSGLGFAPTLRSPGLPSSVPTRGVSFPAHVQTNLSDAMRGPRAFGSTFEDDESLSADVYDEHDHLPPSIPMARGRQYAQDLTRSRSQSLATRPGAIGSQFQGVSSGGWNDLSSSLLGIPGSRYGEIQPLGMSRYGSLGPSGRSPSNNFHPHSLTGGGSSPVVGNGYAHRPQPQQQVADISNISPFVRDVGQILVDDGAFRDMWAGMNPPRDETRGGANNGTASRRHSVSVVQPRRGNIVGFPASGNDSSDEITTSQPTLFQQSRFGRSGLMLTDEELAGDLGLLNLNGPGLPSSSVQPPSQPASLPVYAPLSRSPAASDRLPIPGTSFTHRQPLNSPSDGGLSAGPSPTRNHPAFDEAAYFSPGGTQPQTQLTARFIPGQGIQYLPQQQVAGNGAIPYTRTRAPSYTGPISPSARTTLYQSSSQQQHRRPSDASMHPPSLTDLGKGVPLHAVPASWPLYIVEFKAGRTDLFYLTDLSVDIRVGDLVIVEADRGKDLGKVVNDSITIQEVEAFQREQQNRVGFSGEPLSPGGSGGGGGKKEINPKMIYGKAQQQDAQMLAAKMQDEEKALQLCQSKVRQKKLPMEVIDAEYQWDRRKLTFYFIAEKRIDFRELVRELFRLYKTRIWMASMQGTTSSFEQ